MSQRLDRNGIPILDPPKQANRLKPYCPPGRHDFGPPSELGRRYDYDMGELVVSYRAVCQRCQTSDVFTKRIP